MAGAEARGRLQPVMKMAEYPWYAPHQAWLAGDPAGRRAALRGADLRDADLRDAVLTRADLTRADLRGADLTRADLPHA